MKNSKMISYSEVIKHPLPTIGSACRLFGRKLKITTENGLVKEIYFYLNRRFAIYTNNDFEVVRIEIGLSNPKILSHE